MPTCSPNICPVSPCCVSAAACTIIYSPSWVFLKYLRDSCTSQNTTKIKGKWVAFGAGPRMDQEEQMWHRGFWGKRQHMTNKSLTHWNPKWLYRREEISDFLDSLLLYFAACWARHRLSLLAKMWTSLMSPTQCQNWKLFRINLMLKGQNLRDQASITECMFTHILFFLFLFFFWGGHRYFNWHFPSYGAGFSFPYMQNDCTCMQKAAECLSGWSVHMNTIQGKHLCFGGKKINRCPKKACRQKASIMIDTALEMLWKSGLKYQFLLFCVAMTRCWIAMISVVHNLILFCLI